jgi:quinoprotein glucose dehydrogenase
LYVNANDVPWTGELAENDPAVDVGAALYQNQCALCHGADLKGSPPEFPSLVGVRQRLSNSAIDTVVHQGKGRMPSFPHISQADIAALLRFLAAGTPEAAASAGPRDQGASKTEAVSADARPETNPDHEPKFHFTGYRKFLDPDGYPAVVPPWGTLSAIDLNTGKYLWRVPLGEYPALVAQGMAKTGCENYGGPILTAGGLVIIGATIYDRKLRAFNSDTGELLWQAELPFAGNATPATYSIDGKQYVLIATSGERDRKGPQGAAYVAFALP